MPPPSPDTLYRLNRLDTGIYEFVFLTGSRATVDAWIAQVDIINKGYRPEDTVRFIADSSSVAMPIAYTLLKSQEYVHSHPNRPSTRTLILHGTTTTPQLNFLKIFLNWIQGRTREKALFLPAARREEGIAWLNGED